jgi:beta-N-acetylhexosaminidase
VRLSRFRHYRRLAAAGIALSLASSVCVGSASSSAQLRVVSTTCTPSVHLASWSLGRLAAQVVVVPVQAGDVGKVARAVRTGYGGVLLFGATAPPSLGVTIRRMEASTPQHLGLLVMTDEEGGDVRRLDNLVSPFPWARAMARTMSATTIAATARRVGAQLVAAGVNTDLAPVLDVDGRDVAPSATDPDGWRSFGGAVPVVITDGTAFAKGLSSAHVLSVVKHFPGLGGSTGNTDFGPAATLPWAKLKASSLHTFESAITRGVPAVMVANAHVPGLTPLPASLSSAVMVGALRQWLGFTGLIVTDSLTAGAISATHLSVPAAAAAAIAAGADMVLLGAQPSVAADVALSVAVSGAIAAGVSHGQFSRATLEDAVRHVLVAKGSAGCLN